MTCKDDKKISEMQKKFLEHYRKGKAERDKAKEKKNGK